MGFAQAAQIADRMKESAPEHVEMPKSHVTPLRYTYGSKKRKAKRLASQAKGMYGVTAVRLTPGTGCTITNWTVLASGPKRVRELILLRIKGETSNTTYSQIKIKRICGVTAGTKERIL